MLPLIDGNGNAVFDREEKCSVLEEVFFGEGHLNECKFDKQFEEMVDKAVSEMENGEINEENKNE